MRTTAKIFNLLYKVVTNGIIIILSLFMISLLIGMKPKIVLSSSMEPTLKVGSVVFVRQAENYVAGDIVTFSYNNTEIVTTHRIMEVLENNEFVTKGDKNDSVDMVTIKLDNIEGKVIFSIPKIGYIITRMQTKHGRLITGSLIYIILAFGFVYGQDNNIAIKKAPRKTRKERKA